MKRIGLSMTPEQLTEVLRAHQVPDYIPADARMTDWERGITTHEFLFVFELPEGETKEREAIVFPAIGFCGDASHKAVTNQTNSPQKTLAQYVAESFSRVVEKYPRLKTATAVAEFGCSGTSRSVAGNDSLQWSELTESVAPTREFYLLPHLIDLAMERLCEKLNLAIANIEQPLIRSMQKTIVGYQLDDIAEAWKIVGNPWKIDCFFAVHEMKGRANVAIRSTTDHHGNWDMDE